MEIIPLIIIEHSFEIDSPFSCQNTTTDERNIRGFALFFLFFKLSQDESQG